MSKPTWCGCIRTSGGLNRTRHKQHQRSVFNQPQLLGMSSQLEPPFGPSMEPFHGKVMSALQVFLWGNRQGGWFAWWLGRRATCLMPSIVACFQRLNGPRILQSNFSVLYIYERAGNPLPFEYQSCNAHEDTFRGKLNKASPIFFSLTDLWPSARSL